MPERGPAAAGQAAPGAPMTRFTLRQLSYFIAVADCGSIVLASKRASISESAISTAIAQLEQEFDLQLFLRQHAQGLSLTPGGRALLREAKALVQQAQGLYAAAGEFNHQLRGQLAVGCFVTLAPIVLPELAHGFMAAFPGTQILPHEDHQLGLLDGLRRAQIDIAITYDLQISDDIAFEPLAQLPPHALFGDGHPLARKPQVRLKELAELPMILLDLPLSREYFFALFQQERLEPNIVWRSQNHDVVRSMVANGYGYALANVRPRADVALDGRPIHRVRLAGDPRPMRIGIATLRQLRKNRLVDAFRQHCQAVISQKGIPGMSAEIAPRERKIARPRAR
jgi:DNA-binding transcriptional LysR family regulator